MAIWACDKRRCRAREVDSVQKLSKLEAQQRYREDFLHSTTWGADKYGTCRWCTETLDPVAACADDTDDEMWNAYKITLICPKCQLSRSEAFRIALSRLAERLGKSLTHG